jgi:ribosomal subunit interface protein
MHADIRTQGFDLTDGIRDHTRRRLAYALGRSTHHVNRVAVLLADINGPRGGVDKRCRIRVRLAPYLEVMVEDTQADLYAAIDRATERIGRTVVRSVARQRGSRFAARATRNTELETAVEV